MTHKPQSLLDKCSQAARRVGAAFPVSAANDNRISLKGFVTKGLFLLVVFMMLVLVVGNQFGFLP